MSVDAVISKGTLVTNEDQFDGAVAIDDRTNVNEPCLTAPQTGDTDSARGRPLHRLRRRVV